MTQAHTIQTSRTTQKKKRVGRGNASGKGTYSARGMKGQRARSGGKRGTKRRGFKQALQKVPKLRGFKSIAARPQTVKLADLERACDAGAAVTPWTLKKAGVARDPKNGIKIVASGTLSKKLMIEGCLATKSAVAAIEKAGGSIVF